MYSLEELGWGPQFQPPTDTRIEDLIPARVAEEQRGAYLLFAESGPLEGIVTGRLIHEASGRDEFPAVGDWVFARPLLGEARAVIQQVLPRQTKLSRKAAGERTDEQIMAANVDTVFLVASLNHELNVRRIERYLAVASDSGARPVIILNKADLAEGAAAQLSAVEGAAPGVDVHVTSALTGDGVDAVCGYLAPGQTVVFVGSSGVGKSSLVNRLLGRSAQAVREIRSDDKGRHTTTSRQMLFVPGGGLIIDTPGLRELQLWATGQGISHTFADIDELAGECAFSDCTHAAEPGCAVQSALDDGRLDFGRMESYRKLQREQEFIESKKDVSLRLAQKNKWKAIHKANRERMKFRGR